MLDSSRSDGGKVLQAAGAVYQNARCPNFKSCLYLHDETWTLIQADWKRLDSFHVRCQRRILHISWHDFMSNDEVLSRTGLFDVSYIVRK